MATVKDTTGLDQLNLVIDNKITFVDTAYTPSVLGNVLAGDTSVTEFDSSILLKELESIQITVSSITSVVSPGSTFSANNGVDIFINGVQISNKG